MAEPIYVTKQDYYEWSGIDLALELKGSNYDNISDAVDIFLFRVETWCLDYLTHYYRVTITDPKDRQGNPIFDVDAFKKGVLHQIDYLRRNGDLSIQAISIARNTTSTAPLLAPNTLMVWKNAGMCNIAHKNPFGIIDTYI
jgi:hypothetical protein